MPQLAPILVLLLILSLAGTAAEGGWQESGVRIGIQTGAERENFHHYEAFAVYGLPWDWRASSGWGLAPQVSASAGALVGGHTTGFIGTIGTGVTLNKRETGGAMEAGINADVLDRRHFGRQDFGSILMFGAYIGLSYRFDSGLGIGYRLQHVSNGHIFYPDGTPNPGLDTHLIGVSWNF